MKAIGIEWLNGAPDEETDAEHVGAICIKQGKCIYNDGEIIVQVREWIIGAKIRVRVDEMMDVVGK